MNQQNFFALQPLTTGMVNRMANFSNRDIEKMFDQYNPHGLRAGDRVLVNLQEQQYFARIVGLSLDAKNKKVYADLRLLNNAGYNRRPTRVDIKDCSRATDGTSPLYPGHHYN